MKKNRFAKIIKKKQIITLAILAFLVVVIPLTVYQIGQKQKYQAEAACQPACESGTRCYATTACHAGVCSPTTYACVATSAPLADTPTLAQDGKYHCSGCSTIYNKTFARWASTTADCEGGIVADSQKYTPNCGCSAPGKPLYPGSAADMCSPSKETLFPCSGCDLYNSTQRMFVTWLSRYSDCSDRIQDPARGINPVYTQDLSCAAYAGQRAIPTPTPMPEEDFCSLSAVNNPCYIANWSTVGLNRCTVKIKWSSNRDIKICFQPVGGQGACGRTYGPGTHSDFIYITVQYPTVNVVGEINGVSKCGTQVSAVKSSGEVFVPTLLPPDCKYEADGKTPICVNEGVPGSQVIGPAAGCMPGEKKCGAWLDACGCPGRYWCVDRRSKCDTDKAEANVNTNQEGNSRNTIRNIIDIVKIILDHYGSKDPAYQAADLNGDGTVDIQDMRVLIYR